MNFEKNFFADRLRSLRQSCKLTQKAVGEIIGVKTQVINDMEHGRCKTSIDRAIMLADYFNVPLDYLVGRDVSSECPQPAVTPDEFELVEKLRTLPPEKRQTVETLLNQL